MAEVASAGTLIAAVLETAGYVSQSHILKDFADLFSSAGALSFAVSCIGGLFSIAIFGSYRAARYLVLGPAMLWFLLGPTTSSEGVVWKLGNGPARGVSRNAAATAALDASLVRGGAAASSSDAAKTVCETLKEAGYHCDIRGGKTDIRVSSFFAWFTRVINQGVDGVVSMILHYKDDENLTFISRTRALEILINSQPTDPALTRIVSAGINACHEGLQVSYTLAGWELSQDKMNQLRDEIREAHRAGEKARVDALKEQLDWIKTERARLMAEKRPLGRRRLNLNRESVEFISRAQKKPGKVRSIMEVRYGGRDALDIPNVVMTCDEFWEVKKAAILEHAKVIYDREIRSLAGSEDNDEFDKGTAAEREQILCNQLRKKFQKGQHEPDELLVDGELVNEKRCDITHTVAVYLLRSSILRSLQSQEIQKQEQRMNFTPGVEKGTILLTDQLGKPTGDRIKADADAQIHLLDDGKYYVIADDGEYHPFIKFTEGVDGQRDIGWSRHQAYQTRGLRQKIFSWALNLPYIQGLLLYLISVAYPFVALIVVIPGRAQAFLAVPMAWLWVKSWDIGFATVMILDQVLWNMFPPQQLPEDITDISMPDALQAAFQADPTYNIHAYYLFISITLLAVPNITAYATLKAQRSVLSSFTAGPREHAKAAGELAEGSYGMQRMNKDLQKMRAMGGAAKLSTGAAGGGMLWNNGGLTQPAKNAATMAAVAGLGNTMGRYLNKGLPMKKVKEPKDSATQGNQQAQRGYSNRQRRNGDATSKDPKKVINFGKILKNGADDLVMKGGSTFVDMLEPEVQFLAQHRATFDQQFGRWGRYQMMMDASHAAMDASGGFEINNDKMGEKRWQAATSLFTKRVEVVSKVLDSAIQAQSNRILKKTRNRPGRWNEATVGAYALLGDRLAADSQEFLLGLPGGHMISSVVSDKDRRNPASDKLENLVSGTAKEVLDTLENGVGGPDWLPDPIEKGLGGKLLGDFSVTTR